VHPGARRAQVRVDVDGTVRVEVTAPPERGKANDAVRTLLAEVLGVPRARVEIVGGAHARTKRVTVGGLSGDEVAARLAPRSS
jgi:uncharacterized protein YggU (UPF0235/DUF167 family)